MNHVCLNCFDVNINIPNTTSTKLKTKKIKYPVSKQSKLQPGLNAIVILTYQQLYSTFTLMHCTEFGHYKSYASGIKLTTQDKQTHTTQDTQTELSVYRSNINLLELKMTRTMCILNFSFHEPIVD